ncbi:MAG: type II toxin-antitoxin system RelE/ParE family toxin [Actinomycetota bacterium]|nr:type II toxin-antitoxin system RelE/ParE family toxin [Actinomycetota bacterium]
MAELRWTERALSDLEDIYDFIASGSAVYARYTIQDLLTSVETLKMFPESGRHLPEFPELPYRELISGNYRTIYRFDNERNTVIIITIVHGSRLLKETYLSE